jgi:hypothetical protein
MLFKKKEKICPHCKEPLTQGHRKDRCEKMQFPNTVQILSDNRVRLPVEYKNKSFEIIETQNAFAGTISGNALALATSGAITSSNGNVVVTRDAWIKSLYDLKNAVQKRIDEVDPNGEFSSLSAQGSQSHS